MRYLKYGLMAALLVFFAGYASNAHAQVVVGFGVAPGPGYVGPAPACAYGYYGYYPYACAPYGYYGPDWFPRGVFYGAGPWFRGPMHFSGYVNNHLDPRAGYQGPLPAHGPAQPPPDNFSSFQGNELRDGKGHIRPPEHTGR